MSGFCAFILFCASLCAAMPGHHYLHFDRPLTRSTLAHVRRVLGYEPRTFVPPHTLLTWLADDEQVLVLLAQVPHLIDVEARSEASVADSVEKSVRNIRTQHAALQRVGMGTTGADASTLHDSFHHLSDRSLVVQLRVDGFNLSETLVALAQPVCRTEMRTVDARVESDERHATLLIDHVHCDDAARVAKTLASLSANVRSVSVRPLYNTDNRWSRVAVRTNASSAAPSPVAAALDGSGEILAVSDTGCAVQRSCFFTDEKAIDSLFVRQQRVPRDVGHRKLRAYWSTDGAGDFDDGGIGADGHGTHVTGTALGESLMGAEQSAFNGVAPRARLAMLDVHHGERSGNFLDIPLDIHSTLLRWSADVGARVHSASWGGDAGGEYTADEEAIDRFCFENRDFLVVVAAGNEGPRAASINAPAMAKNALTVGSTLNGIESIRLTGATVSEDHSNALLSPFSSLGSDSFAFAKPDLVAPGGPYVWSANGDSVRCSSELSSQVVGLQGTSMATPAVAGAALLLRQYFVQAHHPTAPAQTNHNVDSFDVGGGGSKTTVDTGAPTASLLRALLVASATPLTGVFRGGSFRNVRARREASGHGRIALGSVLDAAQMIVLSNEQAEFGLHESQTIVWCVELFDKRTGRRTNGAHVVVSMAYTDYPSSAGESAQLVNDLDLIVDGGDVNEQQRAERRSTMEKVVLTDASHFSVAVRATRVEMVGAQTFSLVLVSASKEVEMRTSRASNKNDASCAACESAGNQFILHADCAVCGNGVVEEPTEACDSTACCDSRTCKVLAKGTPCSVLASECRLSGQCSPSGECVVDNSQLYAADNFCTSEPPTQASTRVCTPASWRSALRTESALRARIDDNKWTICCSPLWAVVEHIEFEPLYTQLAHTYVAAFLNSREPGSAIDAASLLALERARQLLEQRCGVGFLDTPTRSQARLLHLSLAKHYSAPTGACPPPYTPSTPCGADQTLLDSLICNGGGTYDRETDSCRCHANRLPNEPLCTQLACSGNGASTSDAGGALRCACFDGWHGQTCAECEVVSGEMVWWCVGVPHALRNRVPRSHLLARVQRSTLAARVDGSYYRVAKESDAKPGSASLDCQCDKLVASTAFGAHRVDSVYELTVANHLRTQKRSEQLSLLDDALNAPTTSSGSKTVVFYTLSIAVNTLIALGNQ